ncbi:MAG: hypothetical protein JO362_18105 [Streptomycetaceae bacterium]|nr:hypothetical protein [Streptomycetaceae bacterium]
MNNALPADDRPPLEAGRAPAGWALLEWAADTDAERVCLVGGSAGMGKSHLIAWFACGATGHAAGHTSGHATGHAADQVNALVPAAGASLAPLVWELSFQLGYGPASVSDLIIHVTADKRPLLIAIPDLHQVSTRGRWPGSLLVTEVLEPLLALPWVRVIAEVRDLTSSGFDFPVRTIDLDDPAMTDEEEYAAWYTRLTGGSPTVPAAEVFPHPVLGRLAAGLTSDQGIARPDTRPDTRTSICAAWWSRLEPAARSALRTLAWARGEMGIATWRLLHAGLHPSDSEAAARAAVDAAAAQLAPQVQEFKLPLPQLIQIARRESEAIDEHSTPQVLFASLLDLVPKSTRGQLDWEHAPRYVLDHIIGHAPDARSLSHLMSDPGFLIHGSPAAITQALDDPKVKTPPTLRSTWYPAAPILDRGLPDAEKRASVLHAVALSSAPRLAELLAPMAEKASAVARWSFLRHTSLIPNNGGTDAHWPGAIGALSPGTSSTPHPTQVIAADPIGQLHIINAADGTISGRAVNTPANGATGISPLADGGIVVLGDDGVLHLVGGAEQPQTADILAPFNAVDPADRVNATCVGSDPQAGLLVVGDMTGNAHLFAFSQSALDRSALGQAPFSRVERLADAPLTGVCCLRVGNGVTMVVAAATDGTIRLWDCDRAPLPRPLTRRESVPKALALTETATGPVMAVAWADRVVHLLRPGLGNRITIYPHHDVSALALTRDGMLIAAGNEGITGWQYDQRILR